MADDFVYDENGNPVKKTSSGQRGSLGSGNGDSATSEQGQRGLDAFGALTPGNSVDMTDPGSGETIGREVAGAFAPRADGTTDNPLSGYVGEHGGEFTGEDTDLTKSSALADEAARAPTASETYWGQQEEGLSRDRENFRTQAGQHGGEANAINASRQSILDNKPDIAGINKSRMAWDSAGNPTEQDYGNIVETSSELGSARANKSGYGSIGATTDQYGRALDKQPVLGEDAGVGAGYDIARREASRDIGGAAAAGGLLGSSYQMAQQGMTTEKLNAQQARDQADYRLKVAGENRLYEDMLGTQARSADDIELGKEGEKRLYQTMLGDMAKSTDAVELDKAEKERSYKELLGTLGRNADQTDLEKADQSRLWESLGLDASSKLEDSQRNWQKDMGDLGMRGLEAGTAASRSASDTRDASRRTALAGYDQSSTGRRENRKTAADLYAGLSGEKRADAELGLRGAEGMQDRRENRIGQVGKITQAVSAEEGRLINDANVRMVQGDKELSGLIESGDIAGFLEAAGLASASADGQMGAVTNVIKTIAAMKGMGSPDAQPTRSQPGVGK